MVPHGLASDLGRSANGHLVGPAKPPSLMSRTKMSREQEHDLIKLCTVLGAPR